jgi:hypothetical protein
MMHKHYCPNCEKDWECSNPDCKNYAAYLCQQCYDIFPSQYDRGKDTSTSENKNKKKPDSPKE